MKKTGAVLVAAGLSSRMGDFKPMLPFGDSTIALHIVMMLKRLDIKRKINSYESEKNEYGDISQSVVG